MAVTINQISIFVENKSGALVQITDTLARAGIDLRALSLADSSDFGVLRLIVNRPEDAVAALRNEGCIVSINPVIAVPISDEPGGLQRILSVLCAEDVFIEYSYAFITRRSDTAYVIFRVNDNDAAQDILTRNGIRLATSAELFQP